MTALLAMIVGILAVGYAVWPLLRGRELPSLAEEPDHGHEEEAEAESAVLLAWSTAAGEIQGEAEPGGPFDRTAP
jgi:hypothetical protein